MDFENILGVLNSNNSSGSPFILSSIIVIPPTISFFTGT